MLVTAFISTIATAMAIGSTSSSEDATVVGNYCQDSCAQTPGCTESYCKDNGLCFGLYHTGDSKCFQPGSEGGECDDAVLEPVQCSEYPVTTCGDVCKGMPGCVDSKWGTYCKTWQEPAVCFGIIVKADGSLCFAPTDEDCYGEPYSCEMKTVSPTHLPETTVKPTHLPETTVEPSVQPTHLPSFPENWCGETPLGPMRVIFKASSVSLFVAGQSFTGKYKVEGDKIITYDYDDELAMLLLQYNTEIHMTITSAGIEVELTGLFSTTLVECDHQPTNLPATTVKPTNLPATTVKPTNLPATTVKPTNLPATTVKPTNLPATTVKPTNLPATTVKPTGPVGDYCGDSPLGSLKVSWETSGTVSLYIAGMTFTAQWYTEGDVIVIFDADSALTSLLVQLDADIYLKYVEDGIYVELSGVFSTTITKC